MKELPNEITSAELQVNANEQAESTIGMAARKITQNQHQKALDLFENTLHFFHEVPGAWSGKAHADAFLNYTDNNNLNDSIRHSLTNDYYIEENKEKSVLLEKDAMENDINLTLIETRENFGNLLLQLDELRRSGILSEDEFKKRRKSLLLLLK